MFNELLENVMSLGIITADDVERLTAIELMLLIIERTNGLIKHIEIVDEKLVNLLETIRDTTIELLNKWKEDGTLDEIINQSVFKEITERLDYVSKRISNRNFTPLFGINAYWGEASDNLGNCWLASRDRITTDINTWNEHGCDEIVIPIHITYNQTSGKFFIVENLDDMRFAVDYCSGLDIKVTTIKIHLQKANESMIKNHGVDDFKRQYKTLIKELVNLFNNSTITTMTVFNEVGWLYEKDEHESFVNECLDLVKAGGYLTGVTCAGFLNFYNIKKSVIYNSDKIFVNTYPRVSSKKEKTKLIDALNGWNSNNIKEHIDKVKSMFPSKNIVISECGVQDYWIALTSPETFTWREEDKTPTNGEAPNMFLLGLINTLNDEDVERVWWWYDLKWDVTKKTLNYYLKGVVNHD